MNQEQIVYTKLTPGRAISYAKDMGEVTLLENASTTETEAKEAKKGTENTKKAPDQHAENKSVLVAKQEKAAKAWKELYAQQGKDIDDLGYAARQTIRLAIQEGYAPQPHESPVRIDVNSLPATLPPEVRQVVTTANELLDLIPPDAYEQQMATLEQSLLKLSTLDIAEETRDEVRTLLRNSIIDIYEKNKLADVLPRESARDRIKPAVHEVLGNSLLSDENRLVKAEEVLREKNLLEQPLSDEQKAAILEAHYVGQGEKGKDVTKSAGVYNYTREQLRLKAEILDKAGFSREQRRTLIEAGIAAEPVNAPVGAGPELAAIIEQINRRQDLLGDKPYDAQYLEQQKRQVEDLYDRGIIPADQAIHVVNQLETFLSEIMAEHANRGERIGWQLMNADREYLNRGYDGIFDWLELQFDQVYKIAEKGQELNSPQMTNMQQRLQEASTYVVTTYNKQEHEYGPNAGTEFSRQLLDIFNTRLNMLYLKTAIERRDDQQMVGTATGARAESVAKALMLDRGRVLMFFNRMNELLEDMRLRDGKLEKHITPEMIETLLNTVKNEQYELARRGIGYYAEEYQKAVERIDAFNRVRAERGEVVTAGQRENDIRELTKARMIRSERPAYDLLVVLQRVSLINARGTFQRGGDLRRTVPGGGLPFNMIKYQLGPGQKLTAEGEQVFDEMLINMADKHLRGMGLKPESVPRMVRQDLGERLFGETYEPADFFSSGWRMNTLKTQIGRYFEYKFALQALGVSEENAITVTPQEIAEKKALPEVQEKAKRAAEDFALFVRLKTADHKIDKDHPEKKTDREKVWEKIARYKPEEVMRLFRDRAAGEKSFMDVFNSGLFVRNVPMDGFKVDEKLVERGVSEAQQQAVYRYDQFKYKYSLIINMIRDNAYKEDIPRQVDFAQLNDQEKALINKYFGNDTEAKNVEDMYRAMQEASTRVRTGNDQISAWLKPEEKYDTMIRTLSRDARFVDIYRHTLNVDDTLVGQMELVNTPVSGLVAISKIWANEPGADALVRNFKDIVDANMAQKGLSKFLDEPDMNERLKGLKEAGDAVYSMNGPDTRVELYRAGLGTILELVKKYEFWDVLNIDKMLFQIPSSKMEAIIGPHAKPLGKSEILKIINEFRNQMTQHAVEETVYDKLLPPAEREHKRHERLHHAEEVVGELKKTLGVDWKGMVKLKTYTGLLFFLIALFAEMLSTSGKLVNEK